MKDNPSAQELRDELKEWADLVFEKSVHYKNVCFLCVPKEKKKLIFGLLHTISLSADSIRDIIDKLSGKH